MRSTGTLTSAPPSGWVSFAFGSPEASPLHFYGVSSVLIAADPVRENAAAFGMAALAGVAGLVLSRRRKPAAA